MKLEDIKKIGVVSTMERFQNSRDPRDKSCPIIVEKYAKGEWGKKAGKGFYTYGGEFNE